MIALGQLLLFLLDVYLWIIIAGVVISWLLAFNVINARNPQAQNLLNLLQKLTDPVMKPVQRFIPPIGGIDISPIVVIFGIYLLQSLVVRVFILGAI